MLLTQILSVEVTVVRVRLRLGRVVRVARPAAAEREGLPVVAQGDAYPQLPESELYGLALGLELP